MAEADIEKQITDAQRAILGKALRQSGVFVTSGEGAKTNIMSLHWGSLGVFWNRDIFVLPVRKSKLSHDFIDECGTFAISVPIKDMRNEIILCDHISGYDKNKFEELNLHPKRAKTIPTYTISECGLFLECKVVFTADMIPDALDPLLLEEVYDNKDFHTIYFGEVLACYESGYEE